MTLGWELVAELCLWGVMALLWWRHDAQQRQLHDATAAQIALSRFIADRVPGELPEEVVQLMEIGDIADRPDP